MSVPGWYVKPCPDGREAGPYEFSVVKTLAETGRLKEGAVVRRQDGWPWECAFGRLEKGEPPWWAQPANTPMALAQAASPAAKSPPPMPGSPLPPPVPAQDGSGDARVLFGVTFCVVGGIGVIFSLTLDTNAPGTNITNLSLQHRQLVWLILSIAGVFLGALMLLMGRPRK